jgi:all-trans-retinol 13,14-reductase
MNNRDVAGNGPAPGSTEQGHEHEHEHYDVVVLGAGWGGLVAATLLAKAGSRVAIVEARDRPGGCGQVFELGAFSFCAEMQYLMGCGPGGIVRRWLEELGLERTVTFNSLDLSGCDRVDLPGKSYRFPNEPRRLEAALADEFPHDRAGLAALFAILWRIENELVDGGIDLASMERHPFQFKETLLYGPWPVTRVFEHLGLSARLRAVLAAQCGDVGLSPNEEPFLCLQALLFGYGESVHFPARGMGFFLEQVIGYLQSHRGVIHYDTPAQQLVRAGDRITGVVTSRGLLTADRIVSDLDPARTLAMIEGTTPPSYAQSASCFTLFLGLDLDLATKGFGRFNVWSYPDEDLDASLDRTRVHHAYDDPFCFLATPSLYANPGVLAPAGHTTLQINVVSDFEAFATAFREGRHAEERARVAEAILAAVERRLVPGLRAHTVVREAWSPLDLATKVGLERGGMYGARLDFHNRVLHRVSPRTGFENLFLTGATAGGAGMQGVVGASTALVEKLLATPTS